MSKKTMKSLLNKNKRDYKKEFKIRKKEQNKVQSGKIITSSLNLIAYGMVSLIIIVIIMLVWRILFDYDPIIMDAFWSNYGSLIGGVGGGLITAFASVITILVLYKQNSDIYMKQKEERVDEIRANVMPWIIARCGNSAEYKKSVLSYDKNRDVIVEIGEGSEVKGGCLFIKNKGVGAALDVELESSRPWTDEHSEPILIQDFLESGDELSLAFRVSYDNVIHSSGITIRCKDIIKRTEYTVNLILGFNHNEDIWWTKYQAINTRSSKKITLKESEE